MPNCIFCKIAKGETPCFKIYENENFLAFLDIAPFTEGHTLVIPKKHFRWIWDVVPGGEYFEVCQKIANHYRKILKDEIEDFVMILSYGFMVPHAHIHILPKTKKGNLDQILGLEMRMEKIDPEEGKRLAEKLKVNF